MKIFYGLAIVCILLLAGNSNAQNAKPKLPVYALNNLSHYYDFHADWGFPRQYLNNNTDKYIKSWSCIYNSDLSNANLLFLFNCDDRLPYVEKDLEKIQGFLKQGGGVMILSTGNSLEQNKLAKLYGAEFVPGLKFPLTGKLDNKDIVVDMKKYGNCHLNFKDPRKWKVVVADSEGQAVLAYKKTGKGTLLFGSRALLGDNPDNPNDTLNRAMWHRVWNQVGSGKKINPEKPFETQYLDKVENNINKDGLDISFNDYLAPCANAMFEIARRCMPEIEMVMGVPLSAGMASKIVLIPTGGGGYSSGEVLALAVWWGGFPDKEESMIEFITHESVHSWVLPYPEVWNEPIATYVGNLVMMKMGYKDEAEKRIQQTIQRASNYDPQMNLYDIEGNLTDNSGKALNEGEKNNIHWGKTYWVLEQLRKDNPNIIADYFKLKRKYATDKQITQYNMNNTVALLSMAMGKDLFPWFNEHGIKVDRGQTEIKMAL
jgi:hypothetical protein